MDRGIQDHDLSKAVKELQAEMDELRYSKLNYAVEEYKHQLQIQKQTQYTEFEKQLTAQTSDSIDTIHTQVSERLHKLDKMLNDGNKHIHNYSLLLEQLGKTKTEIDSSYHNETINLKMFKDKQQNEWKRKAQEFATKSGRFVV